MKDKNTMIWFGIIGVTIIFGLILIPAQALSNNPIVTLSDVIKDLLKEQKETNKILKKIVDQNDQNLCYQQYTFIQDKIMYCDEKVRYP